VLHGSLEAVAAGAAAGAAAAAAAALVLAHVGGAAHVGAVSAPVAGLPALEAGVAAAAGGGSTACIAVRGRRLEAAAAIAAACKCTSGAHMRCMGRWAEPAEGMPCMEKTLNRQLRVRSSAGGHVLLLGDSQIVRNQHKPEDPTRGQQRARHLAATSQQNPVGE